MRIVLLAAALDLAVPSCASGSSRAPATCDPLAKVAHAYGSGADDETIAAAWPTCASCTPSWTAARRSSRDCPEDRCPESQGHARAGRGPQLRLHPLVFGLDECQEAFSHAEFGASSRSTAPAIIKRGPALGIMLVLATQRPDAKSLPTGDHRQHRDAVLPAGHGPDSQRHGARHVGVQARDQRHADGAFRTRAAAGRSASADEPQSSRRSTSTPCGRADLPAGPGARQAAGRLTGHAPGRDDAEAPRSSPLTCCPPSSATPSCAPRRSPRRLAARIPGRVRRHHRGRGRPASSARSASSVKNVREPGRAPAPGPTGPQSRRSRPDERYESSTRR